MYNRKCKSTFLFVMALLCLITLIVPFMNVNFLKNTSLALKIFYYIFLVIFCIALVVIIGIGIYSLFSGNFLLLPLQKFASYIAFIMILLNLIIFVPSAKSGLTVGFSILAFETFVMAFLSDIIKIIRKLPKIFKNIKQDYNEKKATRQLNLIENVGQNEPLVHENENKIENEIEFTNSQNFEQVEIIPPDDDLI